MNHLHDLLDAPPERCRAPHALDPGLDNGAFQEARKAGQNAVCFDLGESENLAGMKWHADGLRLPYPVCWFEFQHSGDCTGVLCMQMREDFIGLISFGKQRGLWHLVWIGETTHLGAKISIRPGIDSAAAEAADTMAGVAVFLTALQCVNVRQRLNAPNANIQKARAKRGKRPLFSYWTLELNGRSERGEHQGGTHASPRVHLRRGHPRQYAPGLWTWVQPCAVGNKTAGMVHKDYSAGPALAAAAR